MKRLQYSNGSLIWFDYNDIEWDRIDNLGLSHFDVFNIPTKIQGTDNAENPKIVPDKRNFNNLKNYFITYCKLTKTGEEPKYIAILANKDRNIFFNKTGYKVVDNRHGKMLVPEKDEY